MRGRSVGWPRGGRIIRSKVWIDRKRIISTENMGHTVIPGGISVDARLVIGI